MNRRRRNTRLILSALLAASLSPSVSAASTGSLASEPVAFAPLSQDDLAAALTAPKITALAPEHAAADTPPRVVRGSRWLYCVQFARKLSGIDIRGNAATWWAKASGLYDRMTDPEPGAVMVFSRTHRLHAGHVAVVKQVVSPREVRVDHANWGNDGKIYLDTPVYDVSRNNDWSLVKVWNVKLGQLGTHVYRLSGFIGN
ncbi:MAG: CHAP domain-containing protein [Pseudomonadota bacterium]|nr:CHAP domain-containing protein [Pseudomonadota bacterium]